MSIRPRRIAALTVIGDGPIGPIGRQLDEQFGMPQDHHKRDWAVGMKFVVDLPDNTVLKPGTVLHTFGYPEPEIFGFLYVHPDRVASLGIFVPSWFDSPARTAYRYLPRSVANFPPADALAGRMAQAGFAGVRWQSLTFGIAALHVGERS